MELGRARVEPASCGEAGVQRTLLAPANLLWVCSGHVGKEIGATRQTRGVECREKTAKVGKDLEGRLGVGKSERAWKNAGPGLDGGRWTITARPWSGGRSEAGPATTPSRDRALCGEQKHRTVVVEGAGELCTQSEPRESFSPVACRAHAIHVSPRVMPGCSKRRSTIVVVDGIQTAPH